MTFAAYSDESGIFGHRYQSIALVSGLESELNVLRNALRDIIQDKNIIELKFTEIKGYSSPRASAARLFIQSALKDFASCRKIRIDILTWDTKDSRHNVPDRDDVANLEEMYYKLLKDVASRWNQTQWKFYPDTNSKVNWKEIRYFLNTSKLRQHKHRQHILINLLADEQLINFDEIQQLDSIHEPLIQLADLFAGLARFTGEMGMQCIRWLASYGNRNQLRMGAVIMKKDKDKAGRINEFRFQLVAELNQICKRCRMGVSLEEKKRLWTPKPNNPINFWNYEPQGDYDKAPVRVKQTA